ncbi:uncharacterized protein [Anabrus simplex]|uniref:uncharacterized protein n=1 Tax=Anabrus simplex TaxID=316456 RepID=UPI0035A26800
MRSFLHIAIGVLLTPVAMAEGAVKVEAVTSSTVIGEGPHWDHEQQVLYFVDIFGSQVRRYVPSTKQETKVLIEGGSKPVSLVVPVMGQKNKFIISIGRDLAILTWDGLSSTPTSIERIATVDDEEGRRENRLNDGKADPTGRLWAGTMGAKKGPGQFVMNNGALFSLSKNRTVTSHVQEISCSNGLTWSVDGRLMYYTDTFTWRVDVMDFDPEKGEVSNRRTFFDFKANGIEGHPDGMTIDTKGRLYFPCFGGSQVIVVDPNGKLVNKIPIPAFRVTSVAFGGKNLDELYVTTATEDVDDEEREKYPLGGCTFRVTGLDAKGFPGQPVVIDLSIATGIFSQPSVNAKQAFPNAVSTLLRFALVLIRKEILRRFPFCKEKPKNLPQNILKESMASPNIECISSRATCGEGPHWEHTEQVLYFVDIPNSEIRKYNPATKEEVIAKIEGGPVSLIIPIEGQKNKFLISIGCDLAIITWDGVSSKPSNVERIANVDHEEGKCENRFNDGKADPSGRLWAGTMGPEPEVLKITPNQGSLFSLSKGKKIATHVSGISCSNGLAWSLDNKIMYYIDSLTYKVEAFDFDIEKGHISNRRTAFDFKCNNVEGVPDGMAIDTEGKLWVACFNGSQVIRVDPSNGKLLKSVPMPAQYITSVTFGGPNLDELFVTSASVNMTEEDKKAKPAAGCTFRVTGIGAKGFPGQPVIL